MLVNIQQNSYQFFLGWCNLKNGWSHETLVKRAVQWLQGTRRCTVVISEPAAWKAKCRPDAIGWRRGGLECDHVEVKTSRVDFFRDKDKPSRRGKHPLPGSGLWYLTPPGIVTEQDVPAHWGLLEVRRGKKNPESSRIYVIKPAPGYPERNEQEEMVLLVSHIFKMYEILQRADFTYLKGINLPPRR